MSEESVIKRELRDIGRMILRERLNETHRRHAYVPPGDKRVQCTVATAILNGVGEELRRKYEGR